MPKRKAQASLQDSPSRRQAALDAGKCGVCRKRPLDAGMTSCSTCRERINLARAKRGGDSGRYQPTIDRFCIDCQASGFHRTGCPVVGQVEDAA